MPETITLTLEQFDHLAGAFNEICALSSPNMAEQHRRTISSLANNALDLLSDLENSRAYDTYVPTAKYRLSIEVILRGTNPGGEM